MMMEGGKKPRVRSPKPLDSRFRAASKTVLVQSGAGVDMTQGDWRSCKQDCVALKAMP